MKLNHLPQDEQTMMVSRSYLRTILRVVGKIDHMLVGSPDVNRIRELLLDEIRKAGTLIQQAMGET